MPVVRALVPFALSMLAAVGCVEAHPRLIAPTPAGVGATGHPPLSKDGDFAARVDTPEVWHAIAARPDSEHLAHTEVVKVIIDSTDGRVYFLQSERWPIHYFFARKFLSTVESPIPDPWVFNKREYHDKDRRFVLGTVSHYVDADVWAFELYAGDALDLESTARAFAKIRPLVFFGDKLRYRPVPAAHERELDRARTLMPVVTTDEIFGKARYQALEIGEAYGYVRVFPPGAKVEQTQLRPYDIVVLGDLPEDLPVVSGVISAQLQAPLGHINVLCHNRKTPNMALRGATEDSTIALLNGKLAHLKVDGQSFLIEGAAQADAERSWEAKRPKQAFKPARDDRDVGLPALADIHREDVAEFGAKTSQLAFVTHLTPRVETPKGFGLPMHAYLRFLQLNGFDKRIDAMISDPEFVRDPERRRRDLDALRADMEKGTVPEDVLRPLLARIKEVLPPGKVRLRSSTNAEDLPGFNGAGLYRSTRVDPGDEADVVRGLREVWASVWLWGAFEERYYYRIDARSVGMAILVQQSIDDDVANGVAITANPFNQGQPGFFINAQASGGSVTGARGDEVPEQILYYTFEDGKGFERLSRASRANGPLLADRDVEQLHDYLATIHKAFTQDEYGMSGRAVDVEFLLAGTPRRIVIVQARPYTVTWAKDRRWLDDDGQPIVQ